MKEKNINTYKTRVVILVLTILLSFITPFKIETSATTVHGIENIDINIPVSSSSLFFPNPSSISAYADRNTWVYTTGGNWVPALKRDDLTDQESIEAQAAITQKYGMLAGDSILDYPTKKYNCHSYAWFDRSTTNTYWINNPTPFMEDPHTEPIPLSQAQEDDIIVYMDGDDPVHSAVVNSVSGLYIECISKWGEWGLYVHDIYYASVEYTFDEMLCFRYTQGEHDLTYTSVDHDEHFTDCRDCDYSVYESHSNQYVSVSATEHRSTCSDCGHVGYDSHNEQYTYINSGEHRVNCNTCGYSSYEDHDLYIETIYGEDNGCDVACRDCSYSFHCDCDPEYASDGSDGHYVGCPDGEFSIFEAHTLRYTRVIGDLYNHSVSCTGCDYSYSEGHSWVWNSTTQKYVCSGCGYITDEDSVPGIMSLPNPELEAYLASLSDEELEEFIASLPEDQVERVTALLPSDDEHLTE